MPFQPLPVTTVVFIANPGYQPPPLKGQNVADAWPVTPTYPPQPGERWDLFSFYLPVDVAAVGPSGPPTIVTVTVQVFLSGIVCFQQQQQRVTMTPFAAPSIWSYANLSIDISLANPIPYRAGETLTAGFTIGGFDQDTAQLNVVLGGRIDDPTAGIIVPAPGSIGYTIAQDPYLNAQLTAV